jgi:hypothetical protein
MPRPYTWRQPYPNCSLARAHHPDQCRQRIGRDSFVGRFQYPSHSGLDQKLKDKNPFCRYSLFDVGETSFFHLSRAFILYLKSQSAIDNRSQGQAFIPRMHSVVLKSVGWSLELSAYDHLIARGTNEIPFDFGLRDRILTLVSR